MDERLLAIAKEKLAGAEVEVIQQAFVDRDKLTADILLVGQELDRRNKSNEDLQLRYTNAMTKIAHAEEIIDRENKVRDRENTMNVNDIRLISETEKTQLVLNMFNTVFRNAEVKRTVNRMDNITGNNTQTGLCETKSHDVDVTTVVTEEG